MSDERAKNFARYQGDIADARAQFLRDLSLGTAENVASLGTGSIASLFGGAGGLGAAMAEYLRTGDKSKAGDALTEVFRDVTAKGTYEPRSDIGRRGAANVAKEIEWLAEHTADPVAETLGPEAGALVATAPNLIFRKGKTPFTMEQMLGRMVEKSGLSEKRSALPANEQARLDAQIESLRRPNIPTPAPRPEQAQERGGGFIPPEPVARTREVEAPKQVDLPRTFQSGAREGQIRGTEAFGGITPRQAGQQRVRYYGHMEEGAPFREWYDKVSKTIFDLTGGDPVKADQLAGALAITSSGTPVQANTMFGFKGWNQNLVGDPVRSGRFPKVMGEQMEGVFANPEEAATGLKRSPFSAGLSVAWRGPEFANRATHDIRDARAWGIIDPKTGKPWDRGIKAAGHRFLDEQSAAVTERAQREQLGGFDDWTPYRSQAAAWISQKAREEGVPIQQAARHFGDFIPEYTSLIPREWVPGDNTAHFQEVLRAPYEQRRAYSEDMESIVRGRAGIDQLAHQMGALSAPTLANRGVYEGQVNPGYTTQLPVGKADAGKSYVMDPASMKVADAIAAAHGILGTQKQVAHNYFPDTAPIKGAEGYRIRTGAPFNEAQLGELHGRVGPLGGDVPMVDPVGARVLEFSDASKPEGVAQRQMMMDELRRAYPGAEVEPMTRSGNLFPVDENFNAPERFSYKPLIEAVERGGPKMVAGFDRAMQTMAPEALAKTQAWAAREGWTQAPWFPTAMQGLAEGGLARLKALQAAGIVPVAFVVGIAGLLAAGSGAPPTSPD